MAQPHIAWKTNKTFLSLNEWLCRHLYVPCHCACVLVQLTSAYWGVRTVSFVLSAFTRFPCQVWVCSIHVLVCVSLVPLVSCLSHLGATLIFEVYHLTDGSIFLLGCSDTFWGDYWDVIMKWFICTRMQLQCNHPRHITVFHCFVPLSILSGGFGIGLEIERGCQRLCLICLVNLIVKWKSANSPTQRCPTTFNLAVLKT